MKETEKKTGLEIPPYDLLKGKIKIIRNEGAKKGAGSVMNKILDSVNIYSEMCR